MESEPVLFLDRQIDGLLAHARERIASFLCADPAGLAFTTNATTAAGTILASLALGEGDEILTTDHAYGAVRAAIRRTCESTGAVARVATIPLPVDDPATVTERIVAAITARTRIVVADHVASPTALILPIDAIVAACRERGVPVLIDGAHAPGMLDVNVDALGADFWCGNLHKWPCAPKGSAVLWVAPHRRDAVRPLVTSHDHLNTFHAMFDWTGTFDPTAWLASPAALDFFDALGWDRVRAHNNGLAERARALVADSIGAARIAPASMHAAMTVVPLPDGIAADRAAGAALTRRLYDEFRVEVPVNVIGGRGLLRISAHLYNTPGDGERLAAALPSLL